MNKTQGRRKDTETHVQLDLWQNDVRPHWTRVGNGYKLFELRVNRERKFVEIDAREVDQKTHHTKRVMLTFDEPVGRAMYDMLKEIYGS